MRTLKQISALTLLALALTACGGEPPATDDPGATERQRNTSGSSGYLFAHQQAYLIVDDRDTGYNAQADALTQKLGQLGYLTRRVNHSNAVATIRADVQSKNLILSKVLLVALGHGNGVDYDGHGVFATNWGHHGFTVGSAASATWVTTADLVQLAGELRKTGKQVVILDGSCEGGATVREVEKQFTGDPNVCAYATTGIVTPSGVGVPAIQDVLASKQTFGDLGRWASGQLLEMAHGTASQPGNGRVQQYGYMNGCSETMRLREALALAVGSLTTWRVYNRQRYNHVFLEPERYRHPDRDDAGSPHYAPAPDPTAAAEGFNDYTLRDIGHLKLVNWIFSGTDHGLDPMVKALKIILTSRVSNQVLPALKSWQNAFLLADAYAAASLVGQPLGKRIAALVSHPVCVKPWFLTTYPLAQRQRLAKYYQLSCSNPDALVDAVLADYPQLADAIQKTRDAERKARDAVISASKLLGGAVEKSLCKPTACDAIAIAD